MPLTLEVSKARVDRIVGTLLLGLGINTMLGWFLRVPGMVEIVRGHVPMVFNTGLCFALTGLALWLNHRDPRLPRSLIGLALLVLCTLTLAEHVADASLGIDMAWVHQWYNYGNTRPGRMAPNTALGFMLIGAVNVVLHRVDTRMAAYAIVVLTFCILAIGLTGLCGYLLAPDLLFGWSRSARMAIHTACGMIAAAIGMWSGWSGMRWFSGSAFFTEAAKVRLLGTAILLVVTTTVGLTGFALMQESLEKSIEGRLRTEVRNRGAWLATISAEIVEHAKTELRLTGATAAAAPLLQPSPGPDVSARFDGIGRRLLAEGYPHVAVEDPERRIVRELGIYEAPAVFTAVLSDGTELVWNGIPMLRIRLPVLHEDRLVGYVRLDRSLAAFMQAMFDVAAMGQGVELSACVRQRDELVCLPNNQHAGIFRVDLKTRTGKPKLPMEWALEGKTGVVYALDYHDQNVVAAYGAITPGLGFVAKQDTVAAYGVIRRALELGAPVIVLIALAGAFALYTQMDPLVTRMHESEARTERAAAELRTVIFAVGDGIMTIDSHGRIRAANPAACRLFGYDEDELVGQNVTLLIPAESRSAHEGGLASTVAGSGPRLPGTPNVKVAGQRKDGSRFALELTLTAVTVDAEQQFVGIMRDVTERVEFEQKLERMAQYDALTGLANRGLFMERLQRALERHRLDQVPLALIFIDLDGFKQVNDTLGHQMGDDLLVAVAQRLVSAVRGTDTVARLGGDEFTIVVEDLKQPDRTALMVADKVLGEVQRPFVIGGHELRIGASLGLVVLDGAAMAQQAESVIQLADARMYRAKQGGKNRVVAA